MIILGIDPGLRKTGYGVIEKRASTLACVDAGVIRLDEKAEIADRLVQLFNGISAIIAAHRPACIALEKAFVGKNVRSAFLIGEARAACIISARLAGAEVHEYAPRSVKQGVAGYGDAAKDDVQRMVKIILGIRTPIKEDAADALALAVFHGNIMENRRFLT